MGYFSGYMLPDSITKCIRKKKHCKYLKIRVATDIHGKDFKVYVCVCEEQLCASCIPTFDY